MSNVSQKIVEENRKVQITGGSTYILSLPKKWVVGNKVQKGTSVLVRTEEDGILSIVPPGLQRHERKDEALIKIDKHEKTEAVLRKVVSAYLVGYNTIRIRAQPQHQLPSSLRNDLKRLARRILVGTEIVTDTSLELTLQVLLDYHELSVQNVLRRMAIITSSMHKDAILALTNCDNQLARSVIETDSEVDRFNLYIIRQLKLAIPNPALIKDIGLNTARDCLGYRLITKSVERTADHAAKIAEDVLTLKRKPAQETIKKVEEMSKLAIAMFEESIDSLFSSDFNLAEKAIEELTELMKLEKEAIASSEKNESSELASLRMLIDSIERTAEYASDIAEIVLNLNIESALEGKTG